MAEQRPNYLTIGYLWQGNKSVATGNIKINAFGDRKRIVILDNPHKNSEKSPDYIIVHFPEDRQQGASASTGPNAPAPAQKRGFGAAPTSAPPPSDDEVPF